MHKRGHRSGNWVQAHCMGFTNRNRNILYMSLSFLEGVVFSAVDVVQLSYLVILCSVCFFAFYLFFLLSPPPSFLTKGLICFCLIYYKCDISALIFYFEMFFSINWLWVYSENVHVLL